jgi:hypothetical protein
VKRFTLYGSPHSLPTYKVALVLCLSGEPFSFRYGERRTVLEQLIFDVHFG